MAIKDDDGNWIDGRGQAIPPKYISDLDKKRDRLVEKLSRQAEKAQKVLSSLHEESFSMVHDFLDYANEKHARKINKGGNHSFINFSGDKRIQIQVQLHENVNEQILVAKQLIYECIEAWSKGAKKEGNIIAVIEQAFKPRSNNELDLKAIRQLRKLKINDKKWRKAMDIIGEAFFVTGSKAYIKFQLRNQQKEWFRIPLELSSQG